MKYDPTKLLELRNQHQFEAMLMMNDEVIEVFIVESEDTRQEQQRGLPHSSTRGSNAFAANEGSPSVVEEVPVGTPQDVPVCCQQESVSQPIREAILRDTFGHSCNASPHHSEDGTIYEGKVFSTIEEFKANIASFALVHKFAYKFLDNKPSYYRVCCKAKDCGWKISATCDAEECMVRVIRFQNVHNHSAQDIADYKPTVRSKCIAPLVKEKLLVNPMYSPRQICQDFEQQFNVSLEYMQGWRTKEQAMFSITGDPRDSFKFVPWMCQRLHEAIPETHAEWIVTDDGRFKQLFVAYGPIKHGFKNACRPLLFIDACHLKAHYGGVVMAATGLDGNNGLYPLAYSFASAENDENWLWFMQQLREVLDDRVVVLTTDRNPSLLNAIIHVFGRDCNSWCLRHLKENFSTFCRNKGINNKRRESALQILNDIAFARDLWDFEHHLDRMAKFGVIFKEWVLEQSPRHWSIAHFPMQRWDWLSTNPAESFNAWIGELRHMTIFQFMKAHYMKVTKLLCDKKHAFERWSNPVGPRIEELICDIQRRSHGFTACVTGTGQFNVRTRDGKQFALDIMKHTCSCLKWQTSGIPCGHFMAVMRVAGLNVYDFVDDWFKKEKYELMLEYMLPALPTHDEPSVDDLPKRMASDEVDDNASRPNLPLPPLCKRRPGRPKKKRIESQFQDKRVLRCSRCHAIGHNRRNCCGMIPE